MKITLERLREIITEEVIKEELAPEIAAPAIAAMLQGMEAETTSDVFGDVFTHMYGEEALQAQADAAQPGEPEEEGFPTEYQPGGGEGDRPVMGFKENINEIIQEEYYIYMIEKECGLLSEVWGSEKAQAVASSRVLRPTQISPIDKYPGFQDILDDPNETDRGLISAAEMAKEQYEFLKSLAAASAEQLKNIDIYWQKYLNLGGSLRDVIAAAPESTDIVGTLAKLHQRLRNRQEHEGAEEDPTSMRDFQGRPISRWSKSQDD